MRALLIEIKHMARDGIASLHMEDLDDEGLTSGFAS